MKIRTSELTGAALDWVVAKCEGFANAAVMGTYNPSTNWLQGGPIIEREGLTVSEENQNPSLWSSYIRRNLFNDDGSDCFQKGPTPLIAACRCYVASKLGDEVEVPEEIA